MSSTDPERPTDWTRVEELFQEALTLPAAERQDYLHARCSGLPELRSQVESLLSAHDSSTGFLVPFGHVPEGLDEVEGPIGVGAIVGAYRLIREIGRGGMGTVFLATRADGSFEHEVAVKVTRLPVTDNYVARRFLSERQILASLHHPHIVTLIDGGTTPSGHAYLAMEYVDGSPITTWLRATKSSLEQRLRMFRQVCSAIQVAHQHGIVHRDLKPANILVTTSAVPKVLDFGIAKLLESQASTGDTTRGLLPGPLTPDYASPEQLRGLPVTTACDVYSLGVLLFEILADVRPYETAGRAVDQLLEQVLRTPVRRVSVAAGQAPGVPYPAARLRGDLDAIVQKAMREDPDDRYASAEELSDDVARFLGGKPILAREPSMGYLLRKLTAQHRAVFVAAAVGLAGIVLALGLALWQRQVAIDERARAEARFDDVRTLANALIFRVHDAVAPLPGSTAARKLIVEEALGYLDVLADSNQDDSLRLELAKGYKQMGRALGDPNSPNLGDYAGARDRLLRALEILEPLQRSPTLWREAGLEAVHVWRTRAMVEQSLGDGPAAVVSAQRALSVAENLASRAPADDELRRTLASAHFNVAMSYARGEEAMTHWQRAGHLFEALLKDKPDDPDRMRNVALVDKYVGPLLIDRGRTEEGLARYRRALELDERRLAANPDSRQAQLDVAIDLANVAAGIAATGQRKEAVSYYERSVAMRERIAASDPDDRMARVTLARVLVNAGAQNYLAGDSVAARRHLRRARALEATSPGLADDRNYLRMRPRLLVFEAYLADETGRRGEACSRYHDARAVAEAHLPLAQQSKSDVAMFEEAARRFGSCPQ